jgi:pyridoxal phosphate enzyme (YggS family)
MDRIRRNLDEIFRNIAEAAARTGHNPADVTLVAVTKFHGLDDIEALKSCGVTILGENRIQEAKTKVGQVDGVSWHLIGHLQTNKAKDAARMFDFVHSVDSVHVAEALDKRCGMEGKVMPVCLEVNVSGEEAKWGLSPAGTPDAVRAIGAFENLKVEGLMTMAPFVDDPETVRYVFRGLRELRDQINDSGIARLHHLSMGMTQDYEVAVEEGASMVRIGSAIFG